MALEITFKKDSGFKSLTIPKHCGSANYDITGKKFGYSPRFSRRINPYKLGFKNNFVKTHFNLPYEVIAITEAQKYLNSRMSLYFPEWQSRWYEQHGHNNLDIFLDTQRPMLIDVNIRELSQFIEVIKMETSLNEYGKVKQVKWTIRRIENSSLFDRYMASGKKDTECYTEDEIVANYNVFECYDSQSCKPKFYDGHFDENFDYNDSSEKCDESYEGYIEYLKQCDDELPEDFYQKPSQKREKKNA